MKPTYIVIVLVIIVLVAGIAYAVMKNPSTPAAQPAGPSAAQATPTATPATTGTAPAVSGSATVPAAPVTAAPAPAVKRFAVNGNDASADLTAITVKKGTPVSITFGADAGTTYHGGLDFRSSVLSTGTITPGSTKTVSFTADSSFSFTPYWPATNIAKPYKISVVVTP